MTDANTLWVRSRGPRGFIRAGQYFGPTWDKYTLNPEVSGAVMASALPGGPLIVSESRPAQVESDMLAAASSEVARLQLAVDGTGEGESRYTDRVERLERAQKKLANMRGNFGGEKADVPKAKAEKPAPSAPSEKKK